MVEGTHTSEAMYGLKPGTGKGGKLWAGQISVVTTNTIDTGLSSIDTAVCSPCVDLSSYSIATGILTFTIAGGSTCTPYVIVVGRAF